MLAYICSGSTGGGQVNRDGATIRFTISSANNFSYVAYIMLICAQLIIGERAEVMA